MARLDLGFSSFEHATAIVQAETARVNTQTWVCDWTTVAFLDKINFVCDATMYRLYCNEFDIPCDYDDAECTELAQKYKAQLLEYQKGLLKNIVVNVYDRWVKEVSSGNVVPALPPSAKVALLNFISIVKRMAESEYTPHFMGMFGSLSEAHRAPNTYTYDVSDVQETITKDQFVSYCDTVKDLLIRPFQAKDTELDAKMFNTRIIIAQKVLMSILWMCEGTNSGRSYEPDVMFDRYIYQNIASIPMFTNCIAKYNARKSAPIAYAVCVTPDNIDLVPEDNDSYPITDTFRLMMTLLYTINTACKG